LQNEKQNVNSSQQIALGLSNHDMHRPNAKSQTGQLKNGNWSHSTKPHIADMFQRQVSDGEQRLCCPWNVA
jgi:hypothetical protein